MKERKKAVLAVIIPVYNGEKYLSDAIRSVCSQPCDDLILVVVDDGSTDMSLQIARGFAGEDPRIHVLHQANAGVSAARNLAISHCKALDIQYLAFLDADDVWCRNFYDSALCQELVSGGNDLIGFHYYDGDCALQYGRFHSAIPATAAAPVPRHPHHFCSFLYRFGILRQFPIEFPLGKKVHEDTAFFFLFSGCAQQYRIIDRPIFIYRSNPLSVCHKKTDRHSRYFHDVIPSWIWIVQKISDFSLYGCQKVSHDLSTCETMQKTYLAEYIEVACMDGISPKRIRSAILDSGLDFLYAENSPVWVDKQRQAIYTAFTRHPYLTWIKFRLKGLAVSVAKQIKMFPLIRHKVYPLNIRDLHE